jgi:hypothetical protein
MRGRWYSDQKNKTTRTRSRRRRRRSEVETTKSRLRKKLIHDTAHSMPHSKNEVATDKGSHVPPKKQKKRHVAAAASELPIAQKMWRTQLTTELQNRGFKVKWCTDDGEGGEPDGGDKKFIGNMMRPTERRPDAAAAEIVETLMSEKIPFETIYLYHRVYCFQGSNGDGCFKV